LLAQLCAIKLKENKKTLKFDGRKSKVTAVSLFLLFAMAISLVALPTATAQDTRKTYAFIGAMPNPVGVGQEVLLHVGITHPLASALYGWDGLSITITKPDGTTETISNIRTDSTGGTGRVYVPTMAGNYTLQTHFPQQVNPALVTRVSPPTPAGTTMLASDSDILTLVVQEEAIPSYPGVPLPTEYWTRPIDAQLREWSVIAGNWLDGIRRNAQFVTGNDYAPETAHILWTRPETQGGLVGDPLGEHSFDMGDAYEGKFASRLILGGKLYYNKYAGPSVGDVDIYREYVCVDLHTGEELWSKVFMDNLTLSFGQLMYWDTYDFHGTYDYLWATVGSTWYAFDAFTGDWVYTLTDVPSGTQVYGPKGEILRYNINLNGGYMTLWNTTNIPEVYGATYYMSMAWAQWRPYGKTVNATGPDNVVINYESGLVYTGGVPYTSPQTPLGLNGYQWNKTIPSDLPGRVSAVYPLNKAIGSDYSNDEVTSWGISLEPGKEGQLLYKKTVTAPAAWRTGNITVQYQTQSEDIYLYWTLETRKFYAFSAETGDYLWETAESQNYLNFYGVTSERPALIAYGKIFSSGTSGIVYCYDMDTGKLLWTYNVVDPYNEILWANNWWVYPVFITDGKIYYSQVEHSPVDPRPRGGPFVCLNCTTGEVIFRADGLFRGTMWGGIAIIGDSIIATQDTYDQRIYAIGKGPSATTVTASPKVSVHGDSVLVEGTVTDISPSTKEYALTARFPNGVPAVADENISDWMLYVYKQFARPADAVGVEVVLEVLDPNNNFYEVGRTTSDSDGFYSVAFTPEVPGKYTIIASFAGSGAYYGSHAKTAINVEEAPAPTPAPTPTPAPMTDTYVLGIGSAILIAVIIGFVLLLLRKR
jgi:outer membrane protein assembly factor BamB